MRVFGEDIYLTDKVISLWNQIKDEYNENNDMVIYSSYPYIESEGKEFVFQILILSLKGVFVYCNQDSEKKMYMKYIMKLLDGVDFVYEMIYQGAQFVNFFYDDIDLFKNMYDNSEVKFDKNQLLLIESRFQMANGINSTDERKVEKVDSVGDRIKRKNNRINRLDKTQFKATYTHISSHSRIRGLAGTGKTILMIKRMAYLHYKNPDLKMLYTFYSVSLKQTIENLFQKFYDEMPGSEENKEYTNVDIIHSWGSQHTRGFYREICKEYNLDFKTYRNVRRSNDPFESACDSAVRQLGEQQIMKYDFIFVDEGQDFGENFFRLIKKSLKPNGKLMYAYDELQMLSSISKNIPNVEKIIGEEMNDYPMSISYRNPKKLLIAAHALGLGIYHENVLGEQDILNISLIKDLSVWEAIGYYVTKESEEISFGKNVVLERKEDDCGYDDFLTIKSCNNLEQREFLYNEIVHLIEKEDVKPEDILIIDLDAINLESNFNLFSWYTFKMANNGFDNDDARNQDESSKDIDDDDLNLKFNMNLVSKNKPFEFISKGTVAYTTVYRAKGNEANIVFVINAGSMRSIETYARQRLFTAVTRARVKAYILGANIKGFKKEYEKLENNDYKLKFKYPTKKELKAKNLLVEKESKLASIIDDYLNKTKNTSKDIAIDVVLKQLNLSTKQELIDFLTESKDDEEE